MKAPKIIYEYDRLVRIPEVIDMTGLPRSTIYLKIKNEEFPDQVQISTRSVAWIESEILDWIKLNVERRNKSTGGKNDVQQ